MKGIVNALVFLLLAFPWMFQLVNLLSFGFLGYRLVWMPPDEESGRVTAVILVYVVTTLVSLILSIGFLISIGEDDGED